MKSSTGKEEYFWPEGVSLVRSSISGQEKYIWSGVVYEIEKATVLCTHSLGPKLRALGKDLLGEK